MYSSIEAVSQAVLLFSQCTLTMSVYACARVCVCVCVRVCVCADGFIYPER